MKSYLIHFLNDNVWLDFKFAELNALLELNGITPEIAYTEKNVSKEDKFIVVTLPNDDVVRSIMERSITIKEIHEYWSVGFRYLSDVLEHVQSNLDTFLSPYSDEAISWSLFVDIVYGTLKEDEKQYFRELFTSEISLSQLPGPVAVNNPQLPMHLILDFSGKHKLDQHDKIPAYFGRLIARNKMKDDLNKYDLKKRLYLGPTSLDHSLALILGNIAQVKRGYFVLDPFVGTASILIAMSHFGCFCFGTDIDIRVLKGCMYAGHKQNEANDVKRDIYENFKMYGLEPPELIRLDNHLCDSHYQFPVCSSLLHDRDDHSQQLLHQQSFEESSSSKPESSSSNPEYSSSKPYSSGGYEGMFDAIVTDPPYSIRAGARKSGRKDALPSNYFVRNRSDHIPSTQNYPVEEVMLDLLHTAARTLTLGGRLIYLIPTTYDFELADLPVHPCFVINTTCEQGLSSRHGRRAVLMTKIKPYTASLEVEFSEYKRCIMTTSGSEEHAQGFSKLMIKLSRALKADAFYDNDVVKRTSHRCIARKEHALKKKIFWESSQANGMTSSSASVGKGKGKGKDKSKGSDGSHNESVVISKAINGVCIEQSLSSSSAVSAATTVEDGKLSILITEGQFSSAATAAAADSDDCSYATAVDTVLHAPALVECHSNSDKHNTPQISVSTTDTSPSNNTEDSSNPNTNTDSNSTIGDTSYTITAVAVVTVVVCAVALSAALLGSRWFMTARRRK